MTLHWTLFVGGKTSNGHRRTHSHSGAMPIGHLFVALSMRRRIQIMLGWQKKQLCPLFVVVCPDCFELRDDILSTAKIAPRQNKRQQTGRPLARED